MVRRVGFGGDLPPEDKPEPPAPVTRDDTDKRPDPIPNARENEPRPAPTYLRMNDVLFPVIKISMAVIIAFKVSSNIMFVILMIWALKEAVVLASKILKAAGGGK